MTGFFMTGLTVKKQPTLHGWWQVNQITTYPSSMMTGRRSTRRPSLYYVYYNLLQEFKSPTTSRVKNCKNWVNPSYLMKVVCHLVIVHDKRVPTRHQIWRVASSCHERWRVVTTFHNPFLVHGITGSGRNKIKWGLHLWCVNPVNKGGDVIIIKIFPGNF